MSGHSKWSTIKRQKEANDARRGQLFSKLARAISLAAKQGGADPAANLQLRVAIEKAKQTNMPKVNIEKALGSVGTERLEDVLYEGFGPEGIPVLVETATDNKNRTAQEMRNIFSRGGGSLASPGSVSFQFEKVGEILVEKGQDPEERMLQLIDIGVEDVEELEDGIEAYVREDKLFETKEKIEQAGLKVLDSALVFKPKVESLALEGAKQKKVLDFLDGLYEHEDVQQVYANIKI